ncbi:hypothetical protein GIB67_041230 [Kingdonia uniflora]|uniref:Polygalacturonase n=1 Tax=Kingdonia uniflora TaxID=39325 RepID=A0A7J7PAK0_9MAGN|nr:hypothetical protein GIB67_041230 [Kingdonia uniflora]
MKSSERSASARSKKSHGHQKKKEGRVFYPVKYGADPSGVKDSSDAILRALNDAFQVQSGLDLLPGVNDLGGVIIDLQGGNYNISRPIRFPASGGANVVATFPKDRHLMELWSPNSKKTDKTKSIQLDNFSDMKAAQNVGIYYEDITFRDLLLDSNFQESGHETFISSSFLGQHVTIGGDKGERNFTETAIDLASNDNAITDVAIFSAAYGIVLRGRANILTGVHCYNKATFWGGVGIVVKLPGLSFTRIDNCYMDWTGIVMEDPVQVHVTNAFFLGDANIVIKSIKGKISGLNIVDNMFAGSGSLNPIVKLDGEFTDIDQVVIDRNNVYQMALKSTVGKLMVTGNGTKWVSDFSSILLFPNRINHLQYSFFSQGQQPVFPTLAVTNVKNNVVTVESNKAANGVVSVLVDQYNMVGELSSLN